MEHRDRNGFRDYTLREIEEHLLEGECIIEMLRNFRSIEDTLSIGMSNFLTRLQRYAESAQALSKKKKQDMELSRIA